MNKKSIIIVACCAVAICTVVSLIFLLCNKAEKELITFEIIFDSNGGSEISKQTITQGELAIRPEDPQKEGYLFAGWKNNGNLFDFSTIIENNITLVAEWIEVQQDVEMVTVKFETDGGTTIYNQIIEKGLKATCPANPIKQGYTFKGWYYNETLFDFNTEVNEDILLIAKWNKETEVENKPTSNTNNNNNSNNPDQNNSTNSNVETKKYKTPVLGNGYEGRVPEYVGKENGIYIYDLCVKNMSDYFDDEYKDCIVDGYDVFEKVGTEYRYISTGEVGGAVVVEVEAGAKKVLIARVFVLNATGKKEYSDYSNELIIDNTTCKAPVLGNGYEGRIPDYVGKENGKYIYDLCVKNISDYCYNDYEECIVDGYDVFEKVGTEYRYISTGEVGGAAVVEVEAGTKKVLVARTYILNSKNQKIYSKNSNELIIDKTTCKAPILGNGYEGRIPDYVGKENGKYIYDLCVKNMSDYCYNDYRDCIVDGYDVFEKVGTEYRYIATGEIGGAAVVEVEEGTKKVLVARTYILNSNNQKIYSRNSNELIIDRTQ